MNEPEISKEELMVMIQDFLNSIRDKYTIREQKSAVKIFNEFFDYYLKYNREGIAGKLKKLQNDLGKY